MTIKTERLEDYWRAYDPEDPWIDGFGATPAEALLAAEAGQREQLSGAIPGELTPHTVPEAAGNASGKTAKRRKRVKQPRLELTAEKQLDYSGRKYLPVADKLLEKHCLTVPERARAMLARRIADTRELPADKWLEGEEREAKNRVYWNCEGFVGGKPQWERVEVKPGDPVILHRIESIEGREERQDVVLDPPESAGTPKKEPRSPIPALKSARKHLLKLLEYAEQPPAHKERVAGRCASLRAVFLSGGSFVAWELALESTTDGTNYGKLLDALEEGHVEAEELRRWLARVNRILGRNENWRKAPPKWMLTKRIVNDGWLAWNAARRGWNEYYQRPTYGCGKLTGPLPDFLRDLIACCNGTHKWVEKPARYVPKYAPPPPARLGDGLTMTDEALHSAIQRQEAFYREHVQPILKKDN